VQIDLTEMFPGDEHSLSAAATSPRQLARSTRLTWDNGFTNATVDSRMDVQTSVARYVYSVISGAIDISAAE